MSHEATLWAVRCFDVPLDERMVLVYLADCHCPDNGCLVTPDRLAKEVGIDVGDRYVPPTLITNVHVARLLETGLVSPERFRRHNLGHLLPSGAVGSRREAVA